MSSEDMYQTMSIASLGASTIPKPQSKPYVVKAINEIGDIDGARSSTKYKQFYNKPQFSQADVPGSTSKILSHSRNVRDNTLYIDDIEGSRHAVKDRMMRTNRHLNPLDPEYKLPSCAVSEPPEVKFIKDPLNTSDIYGAAPKVKKIFGTRDTISVADIEGAQANWRPRHVKARLEAEPRDYMDVADISRKTHRYTDRTTRCTDTLNPRYEINGMVYEDDLASKPKQPKKLIADNHFLQTKDINDYVPEAKTSFPRREYRNTNFIGDISGAKADSIKHSIQSNRVSNPLAPVYQSLDGGEALQPIIPPLLPPSMVKVPTVRPNMGGTGSNNNTVRMNSSQRRATQEKMEEINLVRQLQDN